MVSYVGKIPGDRGFHCLPTVSDFADLWKQENVDIPDYLGWSEMNRKNREHFHIYDASKISAMNGNFPDILEKLGRLGKSKISDCQGHEYRALRHIAYF